MKEKHNIFFFLTCLLLSTVFLGFPSGSKAESVLKINKVQYGGGPGKTDEDFIEILNTTAEKINLKGYRLVKRSASSSSDTTIKSWTSDTFVEAGQLYIWANSKNGFAESIGADTSTTQTITDGNQLALRLGKENEGIIIDSINWKKDEEESGDGDEDVPDEKPEIKTDYAGKVKINEIYPSPVTKNSEKEFVEIINLSGTNIDFSKWYVKDENEYKKEKVGGGKSLAEGKKNDKFYHKEGTFSLNSGSDTVFLYDENDILADRVSYKSARSAKSYSFDGSSWRWTSRPTPGQENLFDPVLSGKIRKDKNIYANVWANFEVKPDKNSKKFTWDFGDSHKSYLKETRHRYLKAGKYAASLKITGDGEDKLYEFEVEVEKYPQPKVRIKSISPNPKGKDTDNEWIEIENKTKKKINLKSWSIATGTKSLVNHPIREDLEIKAGKTKKLTRKICAFTLANTKTKIELRTPDGKAVQSLKYDKKKEKMEEDEIYEKTDDGWDWVEAPTGADVAPIDADKENAEAVEEDIPTTEENNTEYINMTEEEIFSSIGKSSADPAWDEKRQNQIVLLAAGSNIKTPSILLENQPRVLGVSTKKSEKFEETWKNRLFDIFWTKINSGLNRIMNKIPSF